VLYGGGNRRHSCRWREQRGAGRRHRGRPSQEEACRQGWCPCREGGADVSSSADTGVPRLRIPS
jgi:hypothetical protein